MNSNLKNRVQKLAVVRAGARRRAIAPTMDNNLIPLPPLPTPPEVTRINEVCWIRDVDDSRTVSVHGVPLFHYDRGDRVSERQATSKRCNWPIFSGP